MLFKTPTVRRYLHDRTLIFLTPQTRPNNLTHFLQRSRIGSLKVAWRKDPKLDHAFDADKHYKLVARVVKEVLNEPGQVIPLRYIEKRREKLRLRFKAKAFIAKYPNLFDLYRDSIKPKTQAVPFLRPSERLRRFLGEEQRIYAENEGFVVSKLCKLLMMSSKRALRVDKLAHVKRDFGFPNDFLTHLVPKYPEHFRLVGSGEEGKTFVELVSWDPSYAKSVIQRRAELEPEVRPNFKYRMPPGFRLRKEMREWVRDWLELEYMSPYEDPSGLDRGSLEMEKWRVGLLHEVISLSVCKRVPVPTLGKFWEEYRLSNAFSSTFTRHPGIFYMSLKGGVETAVLREAYDGNVLVDQGDPLLEIKDKFVELMDEGWWEWKEWRWKRSEEARKQKALESEALW